MAGSNSEQSDRFYLTTQSAMAYPPFPVAIAPDQMGTLLYNCVPNCHEIIEFPQIQISYYSLSYCSKHHCDCH
ncbi:MAG: hypothetical protein V7L29_29815 [Nostoc sp.]|uniref:hypothetical protein n=1 Tax=Nostoc sp. TaxID=1180 RepID=UPI002FF34EC0